MTVTCAERIAWAELVDYWAGDLAAERQDAIDEHLMGCSTCTAESARVAAITEAVRGMLPPIVSTEMVAVLRKRGLRVLENPMQPGERKEVVFPSDVDLLLHRLQGLPLGDAASVHFTMLEESTQRVMARADDVPFDRTTGSVLVACQKHYASMPHDTVAEIRVRSASGQESVQRFTILHIFELRTVHVKRAWSSASSTYEALIAAL
jgi:hypothetical protein